MSSEYWTGNQGDAPLHAALSYTLDLCSNAHDFSYWRLLATRRAWGEDDFECDRCDPFECSCENSDLDTEDVQ